MIALPFARASLVWFHLQQRWHGPTVQQHGAIGLYQNTLLEKGKNSLQQICKIATDMQDGFIGEHLTSHQTTTGKDLTNEQTQTEISNMNDG